MDVTPVIGREAVVGFTNGFLSGIRFSGLHGMQKYLEIQHFRISPTDVFITEKQSAVKIRR